jgi:hypothetical protein
MCCTFFILSFDKVASIIDGINEILTHLLY